MDENSLVPRRRFWAERWSDFRESAREFALGWVHYFWPFILVGLLDWFDVWERFCGKGPPMIATVAMWVTAAFIASLQVYHQLRMEGAYERGAVEAKGRLWDRNKIDSDIIRAVVTEQLATHNLLKSRDQDEAAEAQKRIITKEDDRWF